MTDKMTAVQPAKEPSPIRLTFSGAAERVKEVFDSIAKRAYELFEGNGRIEGRDQENWFKAENEMFHPVHVHMTESEEGFEIRAEVPGFSEKDLEVTMEPDRLVISGNRQSTKEEKRGKAIYTETCSDSIMRVVDLPATVNTEKTIATLKNGILEIQLAKAAKPQIVKVQPKVAA